MPDNRTGNIAKLQKIKRIEDFMRNSGHFTEQATPDVEELMFGDEKFIENNSFATSHQNVNVYGKPEKRYEIRSEDIAVDVQVHRENSSFPEIPKPTAPMEVKLPEKQKEATDAPIKIGDKVKSKTLGIGTVLAIEGKADFSVLIIHFAGGDKKFQYPTAFESGFLTKA